MEFRFKSNVWEASGEASEAMSEKLLEKLLKQRLSTLSLQKSLTPLTRKKKITEHRKVYSVEVLQSRVRFLLIDFPLFL